MKKNGKNINWLKLHREILGNPTIMQDSDYLAVWIWLLLNADHSGEEQRTFNNERITLEPGQLTCGRKQIATALKVNESKIQRILKRFENEQQIEQVTDHKCRLISIVNWDYYQNDEQVNEQEVNECRTSDEQVVNTIQEYKTNKNKRNTISSNKLSDEFDELWEMYPRKEGKKKARDAYIRARKNGTSYEDVMNGIRNYQNHIEQTGMDRKYIKMGSTYFNGRCWEDRFEFTESVEDVLERWRNDNARI